MEVYLWISLILFLASFNQGLSGLIHRLGIKKLPKGIQLYWDYPFGLISGAMAGLLSAAAPLIIVYMTLQSWGKNQIKVSLPGFFIISGTVVAIFHALTGPTTAYTLKLIAVSPPLTPTGYLFGSLLYGKLNEVQYRKVMLTLLAFLGVFTLWRA